MEEEINKAKFLLPSLKKICRSIVRTDQKTLRAFTVRLVPFMEEDNHYPPLKVFMTDAYLTKMHFDIMIDQTIRRELFS